MRSKHRTAEIARSDKGMTRRQCLITMAAAAAASMTSAFGLGENPRTNLRLALSVDTLAGANVNDARAAYRVWLGEVRNQLGPAIAEPVPAIFLPSEELISGVRQGTVDCYGITALEFFKIADLTEPDSLVIQDYLADGMEYVLLVHNSSPFKSIGDLRNAKIMSHLHRDMVLLPAWLDTLLAAKNLPAAEHFFASQDYHDRLNQVVLPVFFRHMDGACMARRSWETAIELNPQLGRDLRAVAISPKIIPIVFGFRRSTSASARKSLIDAIQRINTVPGGRQIVALFQSRDFVVRPTSLMTQTLEMVHQYDRLSAQQAHGRKGPA